MARGPAWVLFARHAQSRANVEGIISALHPGSPLSSIGRRQALNLATELRVDPPTRIFSSSLLRAEATARIVAHCLGIEAVDVRPDLDEIRLGELHGTPSGPTGWGTAEASWGEWVSGRTDARPHPTAESGREVLERFRRFADVLAGLRGQRTLVISHGGFLQLSLSAYCENLPRDYGRVHWLRNCGVAEVTITGRHLECASWQGVPFTLAESAR